MSAAGYKIHKRQLFHWIGREITQQNRGRKVLSDALVQKCLAYVRGSLERGLWVKSPSAPEEFAYGSERLSLIKPITCFTEWSLGESLPHTRNYGLIGFGFPKRWVIDRGGQSVTYFRHAKKSAFLRSVFRVLKSLGEQAEAGEGKPASTAPDDFLYLAHFMKVIREPKRVGVGRRVRAEGRRAKAAKRPYPVATFRRRFGAELPFVEEREWRVVHHPSNRFFVEGPGVPDFYLPYVPGDELFTLVLPDNKTVSALLQRDWFTQRLFTPWKAYPQLNGRHVPPVSLMAHSDVGTF